MEVEDIKEKINTFDNHIEDERQQINNITLAQDKIKFEIQNLQVTYNVCILSHLAKLKSWQRETKTRKPYIFVLVSESRVKFLQNTPLLLCIYCTLNH